MGTGQRVYRIDGAHIKGLPKRTWFQDSEEIHDWSSKPDRAEKRVANVRSGGRKYTLYTSTVLV